MKPKSPVAVRIMKVCVLASSIQRISEKTKEIIKKDRETTAFPSSSAIFRY